MTATAKKQADAAASPRERAAMELVSVLGRLDALEDEKREWMTGYRHEKELLLTRVRELREQIRTGQGELFDRE